MFKNLLTKSEIIKYKNDGAIILRKKFNTSWIENPENFLDRQCI